MVKTRVKAQSGVDLRWEIRRIGAPANHSDKGGQHD
jgi:UDP-N-acetylenolpyruvoylglucosamine reductase